MSYDWPYADIALRVQIVTEAELYGLKPTSRAWEVHRATIRKWARELRENPETCDLLQKCKDLERMSVRQKQAYAHKAAHTALLAKLRESGNDLADVVAAFVATAKVAGVHRGDNKAAAKKSGNSPGGVTITLPQVLTSPRLETPNEATNDS